MLKRVPRFFTSTAIIFVLTCGALLPVAAEDASAQAADAFFAGIVKEATPEKIVVGRTVRGRAESREFRLRPDTKIEGTLASSVRVTVRYISDDDGDIALMIVVRSPRGEKKKKN
jgi:hypothetical protein